MSWRFASTLHQDVHITDLNVTRVDVSQHVQRNLLCSPVIVFYVMLFKFWKWGIVAMTWRNWYVYREIIKREIVLCGIWLLDASCCQIPILGKGIGGTCLSGTGEVRDVIGFSFPRNVEFFSIWTLRKRWGGKYEERVFRGFFFGFILSVLLDFTFYFCSSCLSRWRAKRFILVTF